MALTAPRCSLAHDTNLALGRISSSKSVVSRALQSCSTCILMRCAGPSSTKNRSKRPLKDTWNRGSCVGKGEGNDEEWKSSCTWCWMRNEQIFERRIGRRRGRERGKNQCSVQTRPSRQTDNRSGKDERHTCGRGENRTIYPIANGGLLVRGLKKSGRCEEKGAGPMGAG